MLVLSWTEKEKTVIQRYKKGVSPKDIAHEVKMSLRDVYKIIKKQFGEKKTELTNEVNAVMLYRRQDKDNMPVAEVAIKLRIPPEEAMQYHIKYNDMIHLGEFGKVYHMVKGKGELKGLLDICEAMKIENMTVKDMVSAYQMHGDLAEMEDRFLVVARDTEFYERKKIQYCLNWIRQRLD